MALRTRTVIDWHPQAGVSPDDKMELADLQAGILRHHGRDHAAAVFLRFQPGDSFNRRRDGRRWIRQFRPHVSSAWDELSRRSGYYGATGGGPAGAAPVVVTIALSAAGYRALDIPPHQWPDRGQDLFSQGMRARRAELADPANVEPPYDQGFDALVVLAADELRTVDRTFHALFGSRRPGGALVVAVERLSLLWNARGESIEHFGFVDGRSQPLFFSFDRYRDEAANTANHWKAPAPLSSVLVDDPLSVRAGGQATPAGSYLVVRKLEQNVRAFKRAEAELAADLRLASDSPVPGALLMGRDRLGRPTGLPPTDPATPVDNGFVHLDACPAAAHSRLLNPRERRSTPVLARRSMLYGQRPVHPEQASSSEDYPEGGVGILFMANVSDIGAQFEALQVRANGDRGDQFDPIIGQADHVPPQDWPDPFSHRSSRRAIGGHVTMLGGEYLFMPSLSGLASIGP